MVKAFKALTLILACVFVGCAVAPPRVVIQPYVAILPLDTSEHRAIGTMGCDLNGHPVIFVHPWLSSSRVPFVLAHEFRHIRQTESHGGCLAFNQRMDADSMFRLSMEADAYCSTLVLQRLQNVEPDPSLEDIIAILRTKYYSDYDSLAVTRAMPCAPHGP